MRLGLSHQGMEGRSAVAVDTLHEMHWKLSHWVITWAMLGAKCARGETFPEAKGQIGLWFILSDKKVVFLSLKRICQILGIAH